MVIDFPKPTPLEIRRALVAQREERIAHLKTLGPQSREAFLTRLHPTDRAEWDALLAFLRQRGEL